MGMYNKHTPRFGKTFVFSDYVQVDVHMDFIIDDQWKFRWTPLRHKCSHVGGDVLGDPSLNDQKQDQYADIGFEEMGFSLYYNYGWLTSYGGTSFALTAYNSSSFVNLFSLFVGFDVRIPIWGKINFITGFYASADYDRINTVDKILNTDNSSQDLITTKSYNRWYPSISLGIGFEIDRFALALKYMRMRSRQVRSHTVMEERLGFEATIFY